VKRELKHQLLHLICVVHSERLCLRSPLWRFLIPSIHALSLQIPSGSLGSGMPIVHEFQRQTVREQALPELALWLSFESLPT
jgi:hypothetical protein